MLRDLATNLLRALGGILRSRAALLAENALLRQQVIVLRRAAPRPRLRTHDRLAIGAVTKVFPSLLAAVAIVRPETVIRWHRSLWKLVWPTELRHLGVQSEDLRPKDVYTRWQVRRGASCSGGDRYCGMGERFTSSR
jgi:hypothetical protein